jgi:hypothetical protein
MLYRALGRNREMSDMLTRYALEMRRGNELIQFIVVVATSGSLQYIQTAMEKDGWVMVQWRPVP